MHKNQHSKFQFNQDRGPTWKPAKIDMASSINIVIYFYLFFIYIKFSMLSIHKFFYTVPEICRYVNMQADTWCKLVSLIYISTKREKKIFWAIPCWVPCFIYLVFDTKPSSITIFFDSIHTYSRIKLNIPCKLILFILKW